MRTSEREFRAMGTDCHVLAVADSSVADDLTALAVTRVELLEQCWSRFRDDSELNLLNASAGAGPVTVSDDLWLLVSTMKNAWAMSAGLFDPTVLVSMVTLGYDADFATVSARAGDLSNVRLVAAPGMSGVALDPDARTVELPSGIGIDPGAIGKGLASDVIAAELYDAGAQGVLVNLGGDLAFKGSTEDGGGWSIAIEDERRPTDATDRVARLLEFPDGPITAGVATSTTLKRRWAQGRRHHVIDPRTGTMSTSDLVQVTVVADEAWQAEVIATSALLMLADEAEQWLREQDVTAILMTAERMIVTTEEGRHDG